jgi:6-phosphogluconolactonase
MIASRACNVEDSIESWAHDSIARFHIDEQGGELTVLGHTPTEKTPRSFDLDPTGKFLYVCGEATDKLAAYRLDQETGALTLTATYSVGKIPWWTLVIGMP